MWQTSSQNRNQQNLKGFQSYRLRNDQSNRFFLNLQNLQKFDWRLSGGYAGATRRLQFNTKNPANRENHKLQFAKRL